MPYLQSSILETIIYDPAAHRLQAKFRGKGETIVYEDVPQEIYDSLIFADSIGAFFEARIDGRYPARRV